MTDGRIEYIKIASLLSSRNFEYITIRERLAAFE